VFEMQGGKLAFTTDSFVVKPVFFPGGDIGKLAVCGTVNDLAVSGAVPLYLSLSFIIEEGFLVEDLEKIVKSIKKWAGKAGVKIVTGDTKVVQKGEADGVFINTSGVGKIIPSRKLGVEFIRPGDKILVTGTIGDHGVSILSSRKALEFDSPISSDAAPLNGMLELLVKELKGVRFMRDPTRGGLATLLNEVAEGSGLGIHIEENAIPVADGVRGACEFLGLDPMYLANEGKAVVIIDPDTAKKAVSIIKKSEYGRNAAVIGEVTRDNKGKVSLRTKFGVTRIVDMLTSEQLPRIC
jgi:hydrogenase expression/formation protein HypE